MLQPLNRLARIEAAMKNLGDPQGGRVMDMTDRQLERIIRRCAGITPNVELTDELLQKIAAKEGSGNAV